MLSSFSVGMICRQDFASRVLSRSFSSSGITGRHNAAKAEPPGVVTGRYGTIGEVFLVEEPYWPLNTAFDPRFVAYLLRNTLRNYRSEKAAVPGVDRNVLHQLKVRAPSRTIQERIVSALSPYDDLIENNRRRIALLEDAARMLYREWFVQLRFPGHEHVKIINGIPEGWERKQVADACSVLGRGISPNYNDEGEYIVINQKCIRDRLLSLTPARRQTKEYTEDKALKYLDVLINSTGNRYAWACCAMLVRTGGNDVRLPRYCREAKRQR